MKRDQIFHEFMFNLVQVSCVVVLTIGCTRPSEKSADPTESEQKINVGLILDKGGRDDKSFNSAAYRGAEKAAKDLGAMVKTIEGTDDSSYEPSIRTLAEKAYKLIICVGFVQKDALEKVAPQFPKTHFAIVDARVDLPNVRSLMFAEHEGSYLVGYLAGLLTKSGISGFVGGMDVAMIRRFQLAYETGFKSARKDGKVLANYIGVTGEAWANPNRGKELAMNQFQKGADIVFAPAGASALGVYDAAEEKKMKAIGVDSNQNGLKPGYIVTSMLKQVDVAVFDAIKSELEGNFSSGLKSFSLADGGIDYAIDEHNMKIIAPYREKMDILKKEIISGKIKVPDHYELRKMVH